MLTLMIGGEEALDESTNNFVMIGGTPVDFEHSLVSVSKWESEFQKPFLSPGQKTKEEVFAYLKAMIVTPGVGPDVLLQFTQENIDEIQRYIDSSQTATTFANAPQRRGPSEVITSELIYFWMLSLNIPFECQYWHLNRLLTLIRVCNVKNSKQKPMSKHEIAMRNRELNEQRKKKYGTTG